MIKGITVTLVKKVETGTDDFGAPITEAVEITVENVIVGQPDTDEVATTMNLHGKLISYTLAVPKGDQNDWTDAEVILPEPFSGKYRTIGYPTAGIESNIPLYWNKKVRLERYG